MANVHAMAETGQLDFPAAAERLDAITNGNAKALAQVDPEYGIKLKGALATHSASVYKQLTEIEIKRYAAGQKAEAERFLGDLPTVLETTFRAGDLDVPGVGKLTPDVQVQMHRQMAQRWAQITGDAKIADQFEKAVSAAKVGATTKNIISFAEDDSAVALQVIAKKTDPLYVGMTTDEQAKVRQNVKAYYADIHYATEQKATQEKQKDVLRANEIMLGIQDGTIPRSKGVNLLKSISIRTDAVSPELIARVAKGDGVGDGMLSGGAASKAYYEVFRGVRMGHYANISHLDADLARRKVPYDKRDELLKAFGTANSSDLAEMDRAARTLAKMVPGQTNASTVQTEEFVATTSKVETIYKTKRAQWDALPEDKRAITPPPMRGEIAQELVNKKMTDKRWDRVDQIYGSLNEQYNKKYGLQFGRSMTQTPQEIGAVIDRQVEELKRSDKSAASKLAKEKLNIVEALRDADKLRLELTQ